MKQIPEFPGYYITRDGQIWSAPKRGTGGHDGKWLSSAMNTTNGYLSVVLHKHKKPHNRLVHRLVLETFVGPCPKEMEACHYDGDKANNDIDNLRWDTRSNNHYDAARHGTIIGEARYNSKLTKSDARMIVYTYRTELFLMQEIADMYSVSKCLVHQIIHKKAWKHIWAEKTKVEL